MLISTRRARALAGLLAMVAAVAACGSSGGAKSTGTTTATTAPTTGTTSSGGSDTAGQLSALSGSLTGGENLTFKATYTTSGVPELTTLTIEQAPPKYKFSSGFGSFLNTGTTTYFCSAGSSCISMAETSSPFQAITDIFSPNVVKSNLQADEALAASHGYSFTFSTGSYAGQSSKCANVSGPTGAGKYCITDSGVLAYLGSEGRSFTLTSYTTSVPASDFAAPSGASSVP